MRSEASRLCKELEQTEDAQEWKAIVQELVPVMIAYWDVHPHSAMEMLEVGTMRLPVSLAHAFVRQVVSGWKQKTSYNEDAGGGADHCFLSALIFSENVELVDPGWVERVLPYTIDKELKYSRFERMRDAKHKESIVRAIADTQ